MSKKYTVLKGTHFWEESKKHILTFANCGGRGICGKCMIRVHSGKLPICDRERKLLSETQLQDGIRLACMHGICEEDIVYSVIHDDATFHITGSDDSCFASLNEEGYAMAVDIGTTTVVMTLLDLKLGKIVEEHRFINPQTMYGADVISRIESARIEGIIPIQKVLLDEMQKVLTSSIYPMKRMCVCGNAVMTHLFMGADPSSIAKAPYTCKINDFVRFSSSTLFSLPYDFEIQVLPPISAYVGSDVVMDIYACKQSSYENSLLIDLGTNGEISLYHDGQYYVSSAACGPAFEGGNMQCGLGAVYGAIDHVHYDHEWKYTTIHKEKACGICGSGYMSWIAEALRHHFVDESGYLEQSLCIHENVILTQKDIREFQLAKSAIRAAYMTLCESIPIDCDAIQRVFLAGGFSPHVCIEDLCTLGILPNVLASKVTILGNSALKGICQYAIMQDKHHLDEIIHCSHSVLLASNPKFNALFMEHMMFPNIP